MRATTRTGLLAAGAAASMVGASYAAVPLYQLFCQVTGFAGTTKRVDESALPTADRLAALNGKTIDVRFDGNTAPGLTWSFAPEKKLETVKIGERRLAFYKATNTSDKPITGTATFNVSPDTAGGYFAKVQCFCFTEQTLQPGQTVMMPVTYFVDPAILDDPDGRRIEEITLSYTFYPVDKPTTTAQKATTNAGVERPTTTQG